MFARSCQFRCVLFLLGAVSARNALGQQYAVTDLGTLGAPYNVVSEATAINNLGQIVGTSLNSGYTAQDAFLYSGGSMQDIGPGTATAINNLGQIVGSSPSGNPSPLNTYAFLYSGGSMQDLGPGTATAINNLGQVAGENANGGFLYSGGSVQNLGTLGGPASQPYGINDLGQVVGAGYTSG